MYQRISPALSTRSLMGFYGFWLDLCTTRGRSGAVKERISFSFSFHDEHDQKAHSGHQGISRGWDRLTVVYVFILSVK